MLMAVEKKLLMSISNEAIVQQLAQSSSELSRALTLTSRNNPIYLSYVQLAQSGWSKVSMCVCVCVCLPYYALDYPSMVRVCSSHWNYVSRCYLHEDWCREGGEKRTIQVHYSRSNTTQLLVCDMFQFCSMLHLFR